MEKPVSSVPSNAVAVRIHPMTTVQGTVRLPGSKSLTNRALLIASLAQGTTVIRNPLDCDDSRYLVEALQKLGVDIHWNVAEGSITVVGSGGKYPVREAEFFLGNAGTSCRFLTAALAANGGKYVVDGDRRMKERPIGDLVKALGSLGADVSAATGCPPVTIGPRACVGGRVDVPGSTSSQFISAILMAAPLAPMMVEVRVTGERVSRPYVDLTVDCMREFGAKVNVDEKRPDGQPVYQVFPGRGYKGREYVVEGDASAASYFYAAAAVTGGTFRVEGVGKESRQGDARCADVLAAMGCRVKKERDAITVTGEFLKKTDWDCADMPDVVPTLAVVALFAHGRTRLRGVAHLRHKESDRIASVAAELRKIGGQVKEVSDGLEIEGMGSFREAVIDSWGDHRIAMALAIAGLVVPGIVIRDPQVVDKSFPGFFSVLRSLGVRVEFMRKESFRLKGDEAPPGAPAP